LRRRAAVRKSRRRHRANAPIERVRAPLGPVLAGRPFLLWGGDYCCEAAGDFGAADFFGMGDPFVRMAWWCATVRGGARGEGIQRRRGPAARCTQPPELTSGIILESRHFIRGEEHS